MSEMRLWEFVVPAELGDGPPVLAFDPGLVTGFAMLTTSDARWRLIGGEADYDDALVAARNALAMHMIYQPVVVTERFTITTETARKSPAPWSLKANGVLEFLARRHGCRFEEQLPVDAKTFTTNTRLKAVGWYKATKGGHVNDALRHLYLWLASTNRLRPPPGVV